MPSPDASEGNRWGEPKLGSTVPPTEKPSRWTVTSVIAPMPEMRTVHVLASLRIGAPRPAALCAAGVAVDAVIAAEQSGEWGVSDPHLAAPFFAPRPARRGRSCPHACHDHPARRRDVGDTAGGDACVEPDAHVVRVNCARGCQVLPGNCVRIGERALPPNRRPRQHPRCHLLTVSLPCASRSSRSFSRRASPSFTRAAITRRDCSAVLGPAKPLRFAPSLTGYRA